MYKLIYKEIKKWDNIYIFGHVRPDGDCLGSQFGLKAILEENFPKKHIVVVGDKADYVAFLGTPEKENITDEEIKNGLAIVVDCGSADRVSDMRYQTAKKVIKIDHHIAVGPYGDIAWVEEEKPACAQMITEFALLNKLKINEKAALALYTGIVTDTGRFRFRGVTDTTFWVAGALLNSGADVEVIDNYLSTEELNIIHYKGYILENAKFTDCGVVYITITRDIVKKYNLTDEEAASQVSLLGSIKGYPVYFLVMEYPSEIRLRIRSRGPRVDKLANKYGGGGHEKAAGGHLNSWEELDSFVEDINKIAKYYQENGKDLEE